MEAHLAFALALTAVLSAAGVFLYAQLSSDVDVAMERDLRMRADQLSALVVQSPIPALTTTPSRIWSRTRPSLSTPAGEVVAASSHADVRFLTPEQLQTAVGKELFVDRPGDAMLDESLRIFATPAHARDERSSCWLPTPWTSGPRRWPRSWVWKWSDLAPP